MWGGAVRSWRSGRVAVLDVGRRVVVAGGSAMGGSAAVRGGGAAVSAGGLRCGQAEARVVEAWRKGWLLGYGCLSFLGLARRCHAAGHAPSRAAARCCVTSGLSLDVPGG